MTRGNSKTRALLAASLATSLATPLALFSTSARAVTDAEFNQLKTQMEQLADQLESKSGHGSSLSGATTVGGYGELHFNSLSNPAGPRKRELDFHRFVLFFGHEFSDDISFHSELELEHALTADNNDGSGSSAPGEVELEQAYIEFDINDSSQVKAGVFLIPVGILNETHEPPTFYGTERNPVEKNIIPATWWEGGVMYSMQTSSGFSYDLALTSGLAGGTDIRGGRQKVAEAQAQNLAATARVKYTGIAGLEIAGTLQVQDDMTQDTFDTIDGGTLVEAHVVWTTGPVTVKALAAQWDIDGTGASTTQKDSQDGSYIEAAYKVTSSVGIFARESTWDNGGAGDTEKSQSDFGLNYWPHEDVVVKVDYQNQDTNAGDSDGVNIGIGYQF